MKKIILFAFISLFCLQSGFASSLNLADIKPYFRADAGLTYSESSVMGYDVSGFQGMYNFALGAQKDRIRAELVFQERATISEMFSAILTQRMVALDERSLLLNGYYNFLNYKYFAAYVGAGAGGSYYKATVNDNNIEYEQEESGYSAVLGAYAGLSLILNHVIFDLGVDYYYTFKPSMNSIVPKLGLRIKF